MLDVLQENSGETAKYLFNVINNNKITEYYGNNTNTVVSLIRGVFSHPSNLVDANGQKHC